MYAGGLYGWLHFSTDGGDTWGAVFGSGGDVGTGAPLLVDGGGNQFNTISSFAFAPNNPDILYLGTAHGHLWRTTSGSTVGDGWEELNAPYPPTEYEREQRIAALAVHPNNPGIVILGYETLGVRSIWRGARQADGSFTWTGIGGVSPETALPQAPVHAVVIHPIFTDTYFAATSIGVFITEDAGDWWRPFDESLPNVNIVDLRLRRRDRLLFAAAYGRGIFYRGV